MNHKLHIVSFDIPFPADYGGVIDVFYKIKALKKIGVKITLHCFEYGGRTKQSKLDSLCEKVYYYPRNKLFGAINLLSKPYIVSSRKNAQLLENLQIDDAPILFEGLHTCYFLNHPKLKNRNKLVRMHNIEWAYYQYLFENEKQSFIKKNYFQIESKRLKSFEKSLSFSNHILAISEKDSSYLAEKFNNVQLLNAFHQHEKVNILSGEGDYNLYHGNLSVNENEKAAIYLIKEIYCNWDTISKPLIIAGKNPSNNLKQLVNKHSFCKLIENPSNDALQTLIQEAHINLLPTFQESGVKLKLINALFNGRVCLVNPEMIYGLKMDNICDVANDSDSYLNRIKVLCNEKYSASLILNRQEILMKNFDNSVGAAQLMELI